MSDKSEELELINHLLEVEKNASVLIDDAKKEAEAKKAEATAIYNNQFKSKFDAAMAEKKAAYEAKLQEIKSKQADEIQKFKDQIEGKAVNQKGFNELLEKLLFENA